jgi:hypothetical protein
MLPSMELVEEGQERQERRTAVLAALLAVSLAGIADVGEFIASRPGLFTSAPGRAGGSVLGLALWAGLAATAANRLRGADGKGSRAGTIILACVTAIGNVGLTAIHVRAGVGSARTIASGVLGVAALALALASLGGGAGRTAVTEPIRR